MSSLMVACNAVIPFLLYLAAGFGAKKCRLVDAAFLKKLNTLNFRLFYPFVMFSSFYQIESDRQLSGKPVLFSVILLAAEILLAVLFVPLIVKKHEKRSVIIQGIYRSNAVLYALPLAENIFGQAGTVVCATLVAVIVPIYNVTAVLLLEKYSGKSSSTFGLIKDVLKNPLIIGAIAGVLLHLTGLRLPQALLTPVTAFSSLATPLALFALGGSLVFRNMGENKTYLAGVSLIRLVIVPAAVLLISLQLPLSPIERFSMFAVFGTPIAVASYPMAQNMGGDGELAGELVFVTTVLSIVTLFIWVFLQSALGLL